MKTSHRSSALVATLLALYAMPASAQPAAKKPPAPPVLQAVTEPLSVSGCPDCSSGFPDVAGGPAAAFLAAWPGTGSGFSVFWRLIDHAGAGDGDHPLVANRQTGLSGVAGDADAWLLGWYHPGQIWVQTLFADGGAGQALQLNDPADGDAHGVGVARGFGRGLALWARSRASGEAPEVVARILDGDGTPIGEETAVGATWSAFPGSAGCLRPDGGAVVVWTTHASPPVDGSLSPSGVAMRLLGSSGQPLGNVVVLAAPTLDQFITSPSVACAPNGSFAVAWNTYQKPAKSGFDVIWRFFDAKGKPKGTAAPLNKTLAGEQREPDLVARPDNTFLAVWNSADASGNRLVGRWIDAKGKPAGDEMTLYTAESSEAAHRPRVTRIPDSGRIVLSWWELGRGRFQVFAP